MDRPALKELLAAIDRREVDIIVVYKVDRLTRSLADFSKIIERLDERNVSFVSVTQAFNTTSSMGRLTLNVLLSFAQFEREVTAEPIRDKIAASKKKGMWMGGNLPLGYDVEDRKLVINEREAAIVRQLFDLYIELRTVRLLKAEVDRLGIVTKQNIRKDGSVAGGKPLLRGNLYRLLSNPLYIGMILHKGETNPGMHKAVVDQEVWGQVQQIMSSNRRERSSPTNVTVIRPVWALLQDQQRLMDLLDFANPAPSLLQRLNVEADELAGKLIDENTGHQQAILQAIVQRVGLSADAITIDLSRKALASLLTMEENVASNEHDNIIPLRLAIKLQRKGVEAKLVIAGQSSGRHPDPDLCRLIAKAKNWFDQLASGDAGSVKEIAEREKVFDTEITRVLPLAFLAPSIIEDILNGRQPETLNVKSLKRISPLPMDWNEQQKRLGFHQ